MACDMPLPTARFLSRLAVPGADVEAVVPRDADGPHERGASYAGLVAGRLNARIDAGAIIDAFGDLDVRHVDPDELALFNQDGRLLLNVNTPDGYQRALTLE